MIQFDEHIFHKWVVQPPTSNFLPTFFSESFPEDFHEFSVWDPGGGMFSEKPNSDMQERLRMLKMVTGEEKAGNYKHIVSLKIQIEQRKKGSWGI